MLDRSTDRLCRCGGAVQYLSHSASFHSLEKYAPPNAGTKHLHQPSQRRSLWSTSLKKLLAGSFIGLLLCADGFAQAGVISKGVSVKIMPIGDSITEGKFT